MAAEQTYANLRRLLAFRDEVIELVQAFDTTAERHGQTAVKHALPKFMADLWDAIDKSEAADLKAWHERKAQDDE